MDAIEVVLGDSGGQLMTRFGSEISFGVDGLPPIKDGATSVFAPGHGHAPRVRNLLAAAHRALAQQQAFIPAEKGLDVMLRVEVRAPRNHLLSDATNYLGGIADVLEDKSHRGSLPHLGELGDVWLYRNDRQIMEITYSQVAADNSSYTITIGVEQ